jgi:hypothetical protein
MMGLSILSLQRGIFLIMRLGLQLSARLHSDYQEDWLNDSHASRWSYRRFPLTWCQPFFELFFKSYMLRSGSVL